MFSSLNLIKPFRCVCVCACVCVIVGECRCLCVCVCLLFVSICAYSCTHLRQYHTDVCVHTYTYAYTDVIILSILREYVFDSGIVLNIKYHQYMFDFVCFSHFVHISSACRMQKNHGGALDLITMTPHVVRWSFGPTYAGDQ